VNFLFHFGRYTLFLGKVFARPQKRKLFWDSTFREMVTLGLDSLPIVAIISVFIGAVATIQTASNIDSGLIPLSTIGFATRESMLLEFSPTIIALILVGKVGSSISSELGTMRVSEQIDAMEIMGLNPANFLVLPKVIGLMIINPFIISLSIFLGVVGGYLATVSTGVITVSEYESGITLDFYPFDYVYAMIKTVVFAFIITSVPAYFGYFVEGGSVKVGKASTIAVVYSSIVILILNYIITQLLLL
jgi:phospholipid/cholesterol/gamma-HCH transport system permease protein